MEHLVDLLKQYGESDAYPYHMPGHKRRLFGNMPEQLFRMDITEIDGFDNLHAPTGILAALQMRIAKFYGAEESYCLVGSSTAGILSAVSACVPMGGHILMARNCHKAAYHAAYLKRLRISYLYPQVLPEFGIADAITPQQVEEALGRDESIEAVVLVSPTYEGRISPISEIAKVVHAHGKILIVDAAHGAHLVLAEKSRCIQTVAGGDHADIVIQSLHKTLPALTQTAVLHVWGNRVDREVLRRFLHVYQSSSPSYLLMAGIDNCMTILEREGVALYRQFSDRFQQLVQELSNCRHIGILATGCAQGIRFSPAQQDVGKLLLFPDKKRMSGQELYDLLREQYGLQLEMAAEDFCLAMFTIGDTAEGFCRMRDALWQIDDKLSEEAGGRESKQSPCGNEKLGTHPEKGNWQHVNGKDLMTAMDLATAWELPREEVLMQDCVGRISAEFIHLYPPGTPILVPGERFTKEICEDLARYRELGLNIQGLCGDGRSVQCIITKERGMQGE